MKPQITITKVDLFAERKETAGYTFTSPNVSDHSFDAAKQNISSVRHNRFMRASREVDRAVHGGGQHASSVGAWDGGADNSAVSQHHSSWEHLKLSAAMKGHLGNQHSVLAFKRGSTKTVHRDEKAHMHTFHAHGDPAVISRSLIGHGLDQHTVVPHPQGGATIHAVGIGKDQERVHAAATTAAAAHRSHLQSHEGRAAFIQGNGSRESSRQVYERVIGTSPVRGAAKTWGRIHSRWGDNLGEK